MKKANITELKTYASELIGAVKGGEIVRIYDRDKPVADLVPLQALSEEEELSRFRELERQGVLRRPSRALGKGFLSQVAARAARARRERGLPSVVDALIDERRRGR